MVLRIEDTDVERSEARYEDQLIADLIPSRPSSQVPFRL